MKKHLGFIVFFTAIIFIFLGKFIFMKAYFLYGDYIMQFYPWSKVYSEAIKSFNFPFWTKYVNSGFPLMAEGQIGGFYPLNILLFYLLPLNAAYNYSTILHFILAGIFTYAYARKIGIDKWGASLSALVFCFGSSYAGCFYNTVTLRTLAWFPLGLFIIEEYFFAKKERFIFYLGIILGIQLLAGFAQMAAYSAFFYAAYFFYGLWIRRKLKISDVLKIGITFLIAAVLFLPQFILSVKMAGLSTRAQGSLGFALWGSFNPVNLISLCFPKAVVYGSQFYIGIFTLIFFILAIRAAKREINIKPVFIVLLISFFLALGAYNPLYILFIKITHFYSFRNPSKFIFFSCFAAAILSGWGFANFFNTKDIKERRRVLNISCLVISISVVVFALTSMALRLFKDKILEAGNWYVSRFIFGKGYHRHYLHTYFGKVINFYENLLEGTSFSNNFILISLLLCVCAMFVCLYFAKRKNENRPQKIIFMAAITVDLFVFSFYGIGFGGNSAPLNYLKPTHSKILEILQSDRETFRVAPFVLADQNMPWWIKPSSNILVNLDSVASYSPLVQKSYKDELSSLEMIDNSLGLIYPETKVLKDKYDLLRILNVKYVIASEELKFDFLEEITTEGKIILYKVKNYLPRAFFIASLDNNFDSTANARINITKYSDGYAQIDADCILDGFVVFSENYYPGWSVYVDGVKKENIKFANLIQAVAVSKGKHKIIFKYKPY